MHFTKTEWILYYIIAQAGFVYAITRSDCPFSCECDYQEKRVSCTNRIWNKLPNLPNGTNYLQISFSNFGKLTSPLSCDGYSEVTVLELTSNNITSIAEDAFKCIPKLGSLIIDYNPITKIPRRTFQYVRDLHTVSIRRTRLGGDETDALCTVKKLKKIVWSGSALSPKNLECLGSLKHLSDVDLRAIYIPKWTYDTFHPLKNVTRNISLTYCELQSLQSNTFTGFAVENLDLSYNNIHYIHNSTFTNLKNLRVLILRGNNIGDTLGWFQYLSLQTIDLTSSQLTGMPPIASSVHKVFLAGLDLNNISPFPYYRNNVIKKLAAASISHLNELVELDLSYTFITSIDRYAFYDLPNLKSLNLRGNEINGNNLTNLLHDLSECPSLRTLDLSYNSLSILNETFEVFQANKLEELYIHHCEIEQIFPKTFENFSSLQVLDLSFNLFEHLQPYTFEGLANLTRLIMHYNPLYAFHPNALHGLTNLKFLDLNNNDLSEFAMEQSGLIPNSLRKIILSHNNLIKVNIQSNSLLRLDLSHNSIYSITEYDFKGVDSLNYLDISSNKIMDACSLSVRVRNLSFLDCSYNNLEYQFVRSMSPLVWSMPGVKYLNLSGYPIGKLDPNKQRAIWEDLYELMTLHISNCRVNALVPGMFSSLHNLQNLDVSYNNIPLVEPLAFMNVSKLGTLHLNDNLITHITWTSFVHLPRLRFLSLANNPLICTCEVLWIFQAVTMHDLVYILDQEEVLCKSPPEFQNLKVKKLNLSVSKCEDQWSAFVKPLGIILALILAVILLWTAWRYRWHIRYTLFLARTGRGRYEELHEDQEYIYDAFVAYSSEDLPWVKQHLLANVDIDYIGPVGFKLCLHHRDWLVGVDIADNIAKSIAESRRTIVVLSETFADSYWCRLELAMAHMRLDAEGHKRDRLLVILLGEIPARLLTPRLRHILTTKTYLPWPDNPEHQEHFWKTIRKSLRKQLLYQ